MFRVLGTHNPPGVAAMPLTVKLKRQGGFFGFSVDPNDEGQPVLGEPSWQWPDGVEYLLPL